MKPEPPLALVLLPYLLAVCRLPGDEAIPEWALASSIWGGIKTERSLSVVCESARVPQSVEAERGWRALIVQGELDFALVGVLASIALPLKEAGVSIFVISTYETDIVLIKEKQLEDAIHALKESGFRIEDDEYLST